MRITTTFIIIAVASLLLGTLTILPVTESSLDWSLTQLTSAQRHNVKQALASAFEDKRLYLLNLSRVIQSDANLAGALVLADTSRDYTVFNQILEEVRLKSNLEYFELMPDSKVHSESKVINDCLDKFSDLEEEGALCENDGQIMVTMLSPVYLYGEKVGVMFLGANLVYTQLHTDPHNAESGNPFQVVKKNSHIEDEIYTLDQYSIVGNLNPNINSIKAVTTTLWKMIVLGAIIALVFMLIFIGFALRYFFLRPFHTVLSELNLALVHIENKNPFKFKIKNARIWEIRKLVKSLETFVAKIIESEQRLIESNNKLAKNEQDAAIGKLSRQVAHDIRSPLTALNLAIREVDKLPESHRELLIMATNRINSIANDLLINYKNMRPEKINKEKNEISVHSSIRACVLEKKPLCSQRNIEITYTPGENTDERYTSIAQTELQSVISNLLSNAIEASPDHSKITISTTIYENSIDILIRDNGAGIPASILEKLGKEEVTYGKDRGNGLGIFSACQIVRSAGGDIKIYSKLGEGTEVIIQLPLLSSVSNSLEEVQILAGSEIVIIDDDKTVHEVWRHRLNEISHSQTVLVSNIMTTNQFAAWFAKNGNQPNRKFQYFFDYDLYNQSETGLDLIKKYGLEKQATLVTAHSADSEVIEQARSISVPIVPKAHLATIRFTAK
ncbi:MAG: HAMP domain-containing histidine kinase [Bdellovibrionales bacterium]|nr:HAMP domain-containing histidine kinase [Bdellovibrionales bacterium]